MIGKAFSVALLACIGNALKLQQASTKLAEIQSEMKSSAEARSRAAIAN